MIECQGLYKVYGEQRALRNFSLTIGKGEVFGILGPNGAGKTTLFRLLLGLARPSAGTALIMGHSIPPSPKVLSQVGAMIEEPAFYGWMDAAEQIRIHAMTAGTRVDRQHIDATLRTVGLDNVGRKPVKKYSQGMRQRLGLARAILLEPQLLILDEPANGLDPAGIVWLREFLGHVASRGTTIVVSSHQLGEIEKVCDRVAIINGGRLVEVGTVEDIGGGGHQTRIRLLPEDLEAAAPILRRAQASLVEDGMYVVRDITARDISQALAGCGVFPVSATDEHPSLESRFLEITGGLN